MKRKNISGFEFKFFGYTFEVVTVKHFPAVFAVSRGVRLIYRLEF